MPLFHLPVFWFGYFDGFKTLSSNRNHAGRNIQLVFTPPQSPPERDGRDSRDDL